MLEEVKKIILRKVLFYSGGDIRPISSDGGVMDWIFDFRAVLLDADFLNIAAEIFWERFESQYPFQVGGVESASVPLITAIVLKGAERDMPVNGFYIRKSRKFKGLQKIIEGKLTDDPIVLVDDLINTGNAFIKQIEVLKKENKKVSDIFVFLRFRDLKEYMFATELNITITALTSLFDDFGLSIPTKGAPLPNYAAFRPVWRSQYAKPNYFYSGIPKSAPVINERMVYFGSDDGVMRALDQASGELVWEFKILGRGAQGKTIFSSPALFDGLLYFGAYDGNFYALDAKTGKKVWINMDADWIGSSPAVAEDLELVYIGLEFGLWRKHGGIMALDAKTGKKKWEYITMPELTHGSPAYSKKYGVVAIGSNDCCLYLFDASKGTLLWKFQSGGDIKYFPIFDEERGYVIFGSFDGKLYGFNVKDGSEVFSFQTDGAIYSEPLIWQGRVYVSSMDKCVYCLNLDTGLLEWQFMTGGRIFASSIIVDGMLYIGSNDGRFYEIDAMTGKNTAFFQTVERITNKIAYNKGTKRFFVLTYANELFCLEKL